MARDAIRIVTFRTLAQLRRDCERARGQRAFRPLGKGKAGSRASGGAIALSETDEAGTVDVARRNRPWLASRSSAGPDFRSVLQKAEAKKRSHGVKILIGSRSLRSKIRERSAEGEPTTPRDDHKESIDDADPGRPYGDPFRESDFGDDSRASATFHGRGVARASRRDPRRPYQEPVSEGQEGHDLPGGRGRGNGRRSETASSADRRFGPPVLCEWRDDARAARRRTGIGHRLRRHQRS